MSVEDCIVESENTNGFYTKHSDENIKTEECSHVNKSLNQAVKKVYAEKSLECTCLVCRENEDLNKKILMCLQCGTVGCAEKIKGHVAKPRSDCHYLSLLLSDWKVMCHNCLIEIRHELYPKLNHFLMELKKTRNLAKKRIGQNSTDSVSVRESMKACRIEPTQVIKKSFHARGLSNLGNTCFFNSVLQCLAQTPSLLDTLRKSQSPDRVLLEVDDKKFELQLDKGGPVTEELTITLGEMTNGLHNVYEPRALLDALRRKCKQFIGYNQHDSHELLRQLLDTVRTEDLKRYQGEILRSYGLLKNVHPSDLDDKKKAEVKSIGQKLPEIVSICPDSVFKGKLLSTVRCVMCGHRSEVVENFLDLSLPVAYDKPQPPSRRKNDLFDEEQPVICGKSKHQKKKERKAARKLNRQRNGKHKNLKQNAGSPLKDSYGIKEEKMDDTKEKSNTEENEKGSDEENDKNKDPYEFTSEKEEEKEDDGDNDENMKVENDITSSNSSSSGGSSVDNETEGEDTDDVESMIDNEEEDKIEVNVPLATLKEPLSNLGENSITVESCLSQFTACETLTGNNKVCCNSCTERKNKDVDKKNKKPVYQESIKQLLICSPPPVLILHLKRFQARSYSFRKINDHVPFPCVLDIGPFCSSKCEELLPAGQKSILYSLYGVVEHSGSLYGGHYVAYVKVRQDKLLAERREKGKYDGKVPEGVWYYISDSYVSEVSEKDVLNKSAYLLFYERIL